VAGAGTLDGFMVAACTGVVGRTAGVIVAVDSVGAIILTCGAMVGAITAGSVVGGKVGGMMVVVARITAATVVTARNTGTGSV